MILPEKKKGLLEGFFGRAAEGSYTLSELLKLVRMKGNEDFLGCFVFFLNFLSSPKIKIVVEMKSTSLGKGYEKHKE